MPLRTSAAGQQVRQYRLSRVACFALAASLTVGAACAGDSSRSTGPTAGPSGQYELQTIDRVSLPARISSRYVVVSIGLDVAGNGGTNQDTYRQ